RGTVDKRVERAMRGLIAICVGLGLAAAAAGCGPGGDEAEPRAARTDASDAIEEAKKRLVPPPIFLASRAGRQRAVPGKSCVLTVGQGRGEGAASCYYPPERVRPRVLNVVGPGERVGLVIPKTEIVERVGCVGRHECGGWTTVRPLGCRREVAVFRIGGARTTWEANLSSGAYELDVSIDFRTEDDLTGDAEGVVGLLVDPARTPTIVPFRPGLARCPAGS
ncbi:MAG TPA: hypothetical protein VG709_08450, partial [Actinomycetota bacterium]|nr:hypothetical protein [Actinomycetota bacterium]